MLIGSSNSQLLGTYKSNLNYNLENKNSSSEISNTIVDPKDKTDKSDYLNKKISNKEDCETCKNRKYQDGSNDPGVSFKTAAHISPSSSASVVMSHEMEHVTRESAKAQSEDREVISQTVAIHNSVCPECGRSYVSGGTTRTTTASNSNDSLAFNYGENQKGSTIDGIS